MLSAKWHQFCLGFNVLTLKHWEMHGCVVSTVAADALVLKQQAISILSTDWTLNLLDQFHMKQHSEIKLHTEKNYSVD